ncbi:hypothetical protein Hanom_Chr10g00965921 [Helianthus anomalus]
MLRGLVGQATIGKKEPPPWLWPQRRLGFPYEIFSDSNQFLAAMILFVEGCMGATSLNGTEISRV